MGHIIGNYYRRTTCRGCGSSRLTSFMDFGLVPLAGDFVEQNRLADVRLYPMDLAFCEACSLVQILNVVSPDVLFSDYRYLSSITETLQQHFRDFASLLRERFLHDDALLVEFGCNDGVLLHPLQQLGARVLGVDAAPNVVEIARGRGVPVRHGYFDSDVAREIRVAEGPAMVITASNVFAHIDDLDGVLRGVNELLADDGVFVVEVHYVGDLLEGFQFDTVYHEHLCYYSLHALEVLYRRHKLKLFDVQFVPMHGGAVRVFAQREGGARERSGQLGDALEQERDIGICDLGTYVRFGIEAAQYRDELRRFVLARREEGRSLSAFGAAGRATILLNYCGLDSSVVQYIVDESPFRCGRCVPGVAIPVVGRQMLETAPTDDCLITAWNYRDEVVSKGEGYLARGGQFIVPLPRIEVIGN